MGSGNIDPGDRDQPTSPGNDRTEGEPKMEFPGEDTELPADRNDDLPQRPGERIDSDPDRGIATGQPDLLPDVEPPAHHM
ncbi:MAG TPA: hypothetical protein VMQ65_07040 [Candidatus Limnocylindria bacterium]|nr:hypothetical protein [Candidatus Limnocylindria bacterium]